MENKNTNGEGLFILIESPCQTRSGYGDHSRDLTRSLLQIYPKAEFVIVPTRWGETPLTEWIGNDKESLQMQKMFYDGKPLKKQPDISFQVSVPNEFRRIGTYSIGITAGIETTISSVEWIKGANNVDLIIVPSRHSKQALISSEWEERDKYTNEVKGKYKINNPVEILFEGLDTNIYKFLKPNELKSEYLKNELSRVKEDWNFLFTGHWLKGDFGHDRKDVASLIRAFLQEFSDIDNAPGLILKTSFAKFSMIDQYNLEKNIWRIKKSIKAKKLPNVYVLHGDLYPEEMNELYNHPEVKAMVSFTKGEGFGRPLLEFGVSKKPIIASNWSGHTDFLKNDSAVLLPGKLNKIHKSAQWDKVILAESQWFYVDYNIAKFKLKDVFEHYGRYEEKCRKQYNRITKEFTIDEMTKQFKEILETHVRVINTINPILPKLKKITKQTDQTQIGSLPKLKKLT